MSVNFILHTLNTIEKQFCTFFVEFLALPLRGPYHSAFQKVLQATHMLFFLLRRSAFQEVVYKIYCIFIGGTLPVRACFHFIRCRYVQPYFKHNQLKSDPNLFYCHLLRLGDHSLWLYFKIFCILKNATQTAMHFILNIFTIKKQGYSCGIILLNVHKKI